MDGVLLALLLIYFRLTNVIGELIEPNFLQDEYNKINSNSLLWGPYRSNLYLGLRPRIPDSILTGLLWFPADTFHGVLLSKQSCDPKHNIKKFGWTDYHPRYGGIETIVDDDCKLNITTEFVKSDDGQNWVLRVKGKTHNKHSINSIVYHVGMQDGELDFDGEFAGGSNNLVEEDVKLNGNLKSLGGMFDIKIIDDIDNVMAVSNTIDFDNSYDPSLTHYVSLTVPKDEVWKASEIFWTIVKLNLEQLETVDKTTYEFSPIELFQIRNSFGFKGNLHFIQKTFVGDFQFDIVFNMHESNDKFDSDDFTGKLDETFNLIDDKFTRKYQLSVPFNIQEYISFAKEILSQLLGGITYLNDDRKINKDEMKEDSVHINSKIEGGNEGPYELFTCVSSRLFASRGGYWDEGFHLLPICDYDSDLALEIIKSWVLLIDDSGWIAKEQILGDEARSKAYAETIVPNTHIASPPTLMLALSKIIKLSKSSQNVIDGHALASDILDKKSLGSLHEENMDLLVFYLRKLYPKLQKHYEWFRETQRGNSDEIERDYSNNKEIYRWKGRGEDTTPPSGMDDYPRGDVDIGELNVDLLSWMGLMTRSMYEIAEIIEEYDDLRTYKERYNDIVKNIVDVHWSENDEMFCDVNVDEDDNDMFECHEGYVTLMPFIHILIDSSDNVKLVKILKALKDPSKLWSNYGIRSLSKKDLNYHKGDDYWRGNIYVNINYLILEALYHYGSDENVSEEGSNLANEIYVELRENIVNTVFNEYNRTGYAWEQYNEENGVGEKSRHFLGWTSLVVSIMKMPKEIT